MYKTYVASPKPIIGLITSSHDSQGRLRRVETNSVPFFGNNGKLLGYRGISRDITERENTKKPESNMQ
jgi:hypothetical protein